MLIAPWPVDTTMASLGTGLRALRIAWRRHRTSCGGRSLSPSPSSLKTLARLQAPDTLARPAAPLSPTARWAVMAWIKGLGRHQDGLSTCPEPTACRTRGFCVERWWAISERPRLTEKPVPAEQHHHQRRFQTPHRGHGRRPLRRPPQSRHRCPGSSCGTPGAKAKTASLRGCGACATEPSTSAKNERGRTPTTARPPWRWPPSQRSHFDRSFVVL